MFRNARGTRGLISPLDFIIIKKSLYHFFKFEPILPVGNVPKAKKK